MRIVLLSLLAVLAASAASAQVSPFGVKGLSTGAGRALTWAELVNLHADLEPHVARRPELAADFETVVRLFEANRDFHELSNPERDALIAAHDRIVDTLGVGAGRHLRCERLQTVASRVREMLCFYDE
jgi:hypothetical protein